ncbi:MAG: RimK/LysX family protein [Xanthomonadales bacterium]|nr:RimK/LysX family protein [Xanthomonadales bacterium]
MDNEKILIGWREWLALPDLGLPLIKAKIDTGARSSSLHVEQLEVIEDRDGKRAHFLVQPGTGVAAVAVSVPVVDVRAVTDSGGHTSQRPFIRTTLALAGRRWPIELNLTSRSNMLFPMLLGRTAMAGWLQVDPQQSYLLGRPPAADADGALPRPRR